MSLKFCPRCQLAKPIEEFTVRKGRPPKDPTRARGALYCAACQPEVQARHRTAQADSAKRRATLQAGDDYPCTTCGVAQPAHEFLVLKGDRRRPHYGSQCRRCQREAHRVAVAKRRALVRRLYSIDWMAHAEMACFPGRDYESLVAWERRWCYVVARRWWLDAGFGIPLGVDAERDHQRLDQMELTLVLGGHPCPPPTLPSPEVFFDAETGVVRNGGAVAGAVGGRGNRPDGDAADQGREGGQRAAVA